MVEDRITDGTRIAQLLASELAGRADGPLGDVTVVDADRDADPSPDGTVAYGIAHRGQRTADVVLYPDAAEIVLRTTRPAAVVDAVRGPGLTSLREQDGLDSSVPADGAGSAGEIDQQEGGELVVVHVAHGAAVKRVVDALVTGLDD